MSRPLRIEFPGAVYHVTCRGDRREPIYRDDADRREHLAVLGQAMTRFNASVVAYCLMGNHFHMVLHTHDANLSRLMRHVNGVYTQRFNRRHGVAGHLFQGRFKAILVDREAYLVTLCRYVERNPVSTGLVLDPATWAWSSCRAHLGLDPAPQWLDVKALQAHLLGHEPAHDDDRQLAAGRYAALVRDESDLDLWTRALRQQVYLGDEAFVSRSQSAAGLVSTPVAEVPRQQRATPISLEALLTDCGDRAQALRAAYTRHGYTMTRLAAELGLSVSRVSRLIASAERQEAMGSSESRGRSAHRR